MKVRWGTRSATGHTCHVGIQTKRRAKALAEEWNQEFPEHAPYDITRNGVLA